MYNVKLYVDRRSAKKNGKYPIKIAVYGGGSNLLVGVGMDVDKECWSGEEYSRNEPNYRAKNVKLREMLNRVERMLLDIESKGMQVGPQTLKRMVETEVKGETSDVMYLDVIDEYIAAATAAKTKENYIALKSKVIRYAGSNVKAKEITKEWAKGLEAFCRSEGNKTNTVKAYITRARAVVNYALDKEYIRVDNLRGYKTRQEPTRKRALAVDELRQLMTCKCAPRQEMYRDIFVLMFYLIGINAVDLLALPPLRGDRINYRRAKTGRMYDIKVEPEAREIIDKYKGRENMLCVLEHIKNTSFNQVIANHLKKIHINGHESFPDLSPYWARHTWATIAAELDIPMETISAALGHSTGGVTSVYIKFNHRKVDEANRRVIDYVLYDKR